MFGRHQLRISTWNRRSSMTQNSNPDYWPLYKYRNIPGTKRRNFGRDYRDYRSTSLYLTAWSKNRATELWLDLGHTWDKLMYEQEFLFHELKYKRKRVRSSIFLAVVCFFWSHEDKSLLCSRTWRQTPLPRVPQIVALSHTKNIEK